MWVKYNPNPAGRSVGDCSVRAIAKALDMDWETAYITLCNAGFDMCDMPSSDGVWGAILRKNGFYRKAIEDQCQECYTAESFCKDNPKGVFVLAFGGHVATVVDGSLYDSWDSSREIPIYVWYKKEE